MRLIDADKFKQEIAAVTIKNNLIVEKSNAMCALIDKQPTAYDVNKVIKQIELLQDNEENDDMDTYEVKAAYSDAYIRSIDIIKAELIN